MMFGNCIVAQSGGPTAVINASACGAIIEALDQKCMKNIYGSQNGIEGIINEDLFDLRKEDIREIKRLKNTPASALGSCRYHLPNIEEGKEIYDKIFKVFKAHEIRYFFYIGGNDSMDTINKITQYAKQVDYKLYAIGVPKTIDNDLMNTDHCPGYGSSAKYIATSILEIAEDARVYNSGIVTIVEVMGRNAGWLAAAGALAVNQREKAVDLIYLPEVVFDFDKFHQDVENAYKLKGKVIIVVSEGIKGKNGNYILEQKTQSHDIFGHSQLGGVGQMLGDYVMKHITKRVKVVTYGVLQRCSAHCTSKTDSDEAFMLGTEAVKEAVNGNTGYMIGLERISNTPYRCKTKLIDLSQVANLEKKIPKKWINEEGNYVTEDCIQYMMPLIEGDCYPSSEKGLPVFARLSKCFVDKTNV